MKVLLALFLMFTFASCASSTSYSPKNDKDFVINFHKKTVIYFFQNELPDFMCKDNGYYRNKLITDKPNISENECYELLQEANEPCLKLMNQYLPERILSNDKRINLNSKENLFYKYGVCLATYANQYELKKFADQKEVENKSNEQIKTDSKSK